MQKFKNKYSNYKQKSLSASFFFLFITDECSQLANFAIDFFVEVESIFFSISNLQQVIIKGFFSYSNLIGCDL